MRVRRRKSCVVQVVDRLEPDIASFLTGGMHWNETPVAERWGGWYVTGTHGAARHIEVSLSRFVDDIALAIRDDGRGFDVESTRRDNPGLGLVIMEERVRAAGGEVMTWSEPGAGTTVLVCVPAGAPPRTETDVMDEEALTIADDEEPAAVRSLAGLP